MIRSQALQYEYTAPPVEGHSAILAILQRRHVPELAELDQLRRKGWNDEDLDGHFKTQRKVADQSNHASEAFWYAMMKKGMNEMEGAVGILPPAEHAVRVPRRLVRCPFFHSSGCLLVHWLVLVSCCPGGFSSFTLVKKPAARGVGLSLPVSAGGHSFLLEARLRARYEFIEKDILEYDLSRAPSDSDNSPDGFPASMRGRFQLVIVDGHALRTYTSPMRPRLDDVKDAHVSYRDSLHVAQFVIALEAVRPGGTVLTRLSHVEAFPATHILHLLDRLADELVVYKPRSMHGYVVAKGVCRRTPDSEALLELRARFVAGLRRLWSELRWGGPSGRAGRRMASTDLDFVVSTEDVLGRYLDRLIGLGRGVWRAQAQGLRAFFEKKGIR